MAFRLQLSLSNSAPTSACCFSDRIVCSTSGGTLLTTPLGILFERFFEGWDSDYSIVMTNNTVRFACCMNCCASALTSRVCPWSCSKYLSGNLISRKPMTFAMQRILGSSACSCSLSESAAAGRNLSVADYHHSSLLVQPGECLPCQLLSEGWSLQCA